MGLTRTVVVAEFGAPHGIKGEVRLKSFTADPLSVADYGPLQAEDGRVFEIAAARPAAGSSSPDMLVVRIKGVGDRNGAEALKGLRLSIPFDRLPPAQDGEYYHADLVGLSAMTPDGETVGTVVGVHNYGAGDLLEIAPARGPTLLVPFSDAHVPDVDVAGGRVTVVPPTFDDDDGGPGTNAGEGA